MRRKFHSFVIALTCCYLTGCEEHSPSTQTEWQQLTGRNEVGSMERPFLYRAAIPFGWIRQDPASTESLIDTTKSVCEFFIEEKNEKIRLTIHTFPIIENRRIPPSAQVARWKQQFEDVSTDHTTVSPESHGGFYGLFFEGQGTIKEENVKVIGWSMNLASIYIRRLSDGRFPHDHNKLADYTIKASGPPACIDRHREEIIAFAQSFELIDELPSP